MYIRKCSPYIVLSGDADGCQQHIAATGQSVPYVHVYTLSVHCVHVGYACDASDLCVHVVVVVSVCS